MNIKSTSLDTNLPAGAGVGPKIEQAEAEAAEFASLPNFSVSRPVIVEREPIPGVQVIDQYWIADAEGDLVRRGSLVAVRVDRANSMYKVVGVTERMAFTFGSFNSPTAATEYRLALAKAIAGAV